MRIYFKKSWLLGNAVQKSQKQEESKLEYFKRLVKQHLDELEAKADGEKEGVKKAILAAENMAKGGMPVGTIREWKGKKYIKVAPGKWRPKYDGNTRGAKLSIAALKRKADKCGSSEELLQLILENRDRFSDENGRPLPFVKELSDYVSSLNDKLDGGKAEKQKKHKKNSKNGGDEPPMTGRLLFAQLNGILEKNHTQTLENAEIGKVSVIAGEIGKHGYGLKHIIEQRYKKDGKSVEELAALIPLICDAAMDGEIRRKSSNRIEIVKDGIMAIISKTRNGNEEQWILTGYDLFDEKEKATDAIQEVISQYSYAPEFSDLKRQVGAVIDSIKHNDMSVNEKNNLNHKANGVGGGVEKQTPTSDLNIPQTDKKSNERTLSDIRKDYESSKSVTGNKKTVTLPDGTKIKCHYKIVEADAPTASHDERTFAPTKGFPTNDRGQNINDRDYQNDADAQESVRKIAANFNSLALESPPIVTKDGIVISGNNRTMSSKLAAKNGTDKAYLSDLKEMIDEYGLDEKDLDGFKNPRLVLETDAEHEGEYTTEEFAQFNRDTKKTMSNVEKAVKLTKTLNEQKIQSIAEELSNYDTMGELYADAKGCQKFVGKLIEAGIIGENEKAQYCRSDGTLNDTGKDFCETVLVGSVLDEWNIRKLDGAGGKRIRQKLVRAILPLIENKGNGREYSFNKELNEAVDIAVNVAKNHDTYPTVDVYLAQGTLFGEKKPDEITGKLATLIHDEGEKAFAARMKDLGAGLKSSSNGEMDIFLGGIESKQSLMERFLDIKKSVSSILSKLAGKDWSIKEMVSDVLNKIA